MHNRSTTKAPPHRLKSRPLAGPARLAWLSHAALVLALALVASRALMVETLRDPFEPMPHSESVPGGPGAGTSVVLDLLCCVPALLVLARRAFGDASRTRLTFGPALFCLIAGWGVASACWAADRFAAAVGAAHLVAAAALLWAGANLVRDWMRLRLVAGVCFGLLLAYTARGVIYRYIELPDLQRTFEQQKDEFLRQRGWEPGSFMAEQFSRKITNGEMIGFSASPNTYAAIIVLLSMVTIGALWQRLADRDERGWAVGLALPLPVAAVILFFTHSRTALAGLMLGLATLAMLRFFRASLSHRPRLTYALLIALLAVGAAALIGHGVYHGGLFPGRFGDSLNFRWRYWVSSYQLVLQHPLLGVGWNNFGDAYLAVRQLSAPEEIKDPHNFIVRGFTELGVIGGLLFVAWLVRSGWEVVRPGVAELATAPVSNEDQLVSPAAALPRAVTTIAAIAGLTLLVTLFASLDWNQDSNYIFIEVCKLALYASLLLGGAVIVTLRSSTFQVLDDRSAPWLLRAMSVGIGVFLLHSLVDVALFETGALMMIAMLIGAAIGTRAPRRDVSLSPARFALALTTLLFIAAGFIFVIPVVAAQRLAHQGVEALRGAQFSASVDQSKQALEHVTYNAEYAYRTAVAMAWARQPADQVREMIDTAVTVNPMAAAYPLWKARYELQGAAAPDPSRIREGFERALALNPNDVPSRLEYADVLAERLEKPAEALMQYREALRYNAALHVDEGKRLRPQQLKQLNEKIAELEAEI